MKHTSEAVLWTKQTAGSKGGKQTYKTHGRAHMVKIGKAGAKATWARCTLKPVNESQYAMVERETNKIISIW